MTTQPTKERITRFLCYVFGHSFNPIQRLMLEIKLKAKSKNFKSKIQCLRCGQIFKES